jgi:hypothetical protein
MGELKTGSQTFRAKWELAHAAVSRLGRDFKCHVGIAQLRHNLGKHSIAALLAMAVNASRPAFNLEDRGYLL